MASTPHVNININANTVNNEIKKTIQDFQALGASVGSLRGLTTEFTKQGGAIKDVETLMNSYRASVSVLGKEATLKSDSIVAGLEAQQKAWKNLHSIIAQNSKMTRQVQTALLNGVTQEMVKNQEDLREVYAAAEKETKNLSTSQQANLYRGMGDEVKALNLELSSLEQRIMAVAREQGVASSAVHTLTAEYKAKAEQLRQVKQAMAEASKQATPFNVRIKNLISSFVSAQAILFVFRKALSLVINGIRESSQAAAAAEETYNLFITTFENVQDAALETAQALSNSLGLATSTAQNSLGTFADLAIGLQASEEQALAFSETATQTVLDLISFKNITGDTNELLQLFSAGLGGNLRNLRRYGIILREAEVKQRLVEKGMDGLTGSALDLAKVETRLELVREKSFKSQGDMVKTLGSTENVTRRLNEATKETQEIIGSEINKVLTPLKTVLLDVAEAYNDVARARQNYANGISNENLFEAGGVLDQRLGAEIQNFTRNIDNIGQTLAQQQRDGDAAIVEVVGDYNEYLLSRQEALDKLAELYANDRISESQRSMAELAITSGDMSGIEEVDALLNQDALASVIGSAFSTEQILQWRDYYGASIDYIIGRIEELGGAITDSTRQELELIKRDEARMEELEAQARQVELLANSYQDLASALLEASGASMGSGFLSEMNAEFAKLADFQVTGVQSRTSAQIVGTDAKGSPITEMVTETANDVRNRLFVMFNEMGDQSAENFVSEFDKAVGNWDMESAYEDKADALEAMWAVLNNELISEQAKEASEQDAKQIEWLENSLANLALLYTKNTMAAEAYTEAVEAQEQALKDYEKAVENIQGTGQSAQTTLYNENLERQIRSRYSGADSSVVDVRVEQAQAIAALQRQHSEALSYIDMSAADATDKVKALNNETFIAEQAINELYEVRLANAKTELELQEKIASAQGAIDFFAQGDFSFLSDMFKVNEETGETETDFSGGVTSLLLQILQQTEVFQEYMSIITDTILPVIDAFLRPLLPMIEFMGNVLQTMVFGILEPLFPLIKIISKVIVNVWAAIRYVYETVEWACLTVYNALIDIRNKLIWWNKISTRHNDSLETRWDRVTNERNESLAKIEAMTFTIAQELSEEDTGYIEALQDMYEKGLITNAEKEGLIAENVYGRKADTSSPYTVSGADYVYTNNTNETTVNMGGVVINIDGSQNSDDIQRAVIDALNSYARKGGATYAL